MITWSQQFYTISKIFHSFAGGKKVDSVRMDNRELERSQYILNPSKYEGYTKGNFIIVVLHTMLYNKLPSKIELLKSLNRLKKADVNKAMTLKSDILSYQYLINQDNDIIENLDVSPYEAYKNKKISIFGVAEYYKEYPNKIRGRIMKKDILDAQILMQHFNIKDRI